MNRTGLTAVQTGRFWYSVFISLDNPFYPNASGRARTLLYLLHQLFRHQFELLDLRESELTVHESSGFDGSANMTFLGLSFHFARQPLLSKCLWVGTYPTLVSS